MDFDRNDATDFRLDARPAGWQQIINPQLTRRHLLGGFVASPVVLSAGAGIAGVATWYDLEFELAADQSTLFVREIEVVRDVPGEGKRSPASPVGCTIEAERSRRVACSWSIRADAFGPAAFFDMLEPAPCDIGPESAPTRTITVRNVRYGLRFGDTDSGGSAGSDGRRQPPGIVSFVFDRPHRRWEIGFSTDLWLRAGGGTAVTRSEAVEFAAFVDPARPRAPSAMLEAARVDRTVRAVFGDLIEAETTRGRFRIELDRDLVWVVAGADGTALLAHEGRVRIGTLDFAWRRVAAANPAEASAAQLAPPDLLYFSAVAAPATVALTATADTVVIGDAEGHRVCLRADAPTAIRFDAIVGAAPTKPSDLQVVAALTLGRLALAVADGGTILADGLAVDGVVITQTTTPHSQHPRVLRTVVWGEAAGSGPYVGDSIRRSNGAGTCGDIVSPIGPLMVDRPVLQPVASELDGATADLDRVSELGRDQLARFLQVANGDRGGAPDATVYVLHDRAAGKGGACSLRRIHVDLMLLASRAALPDISYSRLAFENTELRLTYEDGLPLVELAAGEYPRPIASSFVWIGPLGSGATTRARLDLSRAVLTCARDYDLMKLRLRFHDLVLAFDPRPKILPARDDARIRIGEDGAVHDARPILVAEFDPQHVMEEAVFRPEPPALPDVELSEPVEFGGGMIDPPTRENILDALTKAPDLATRRDIRRAVRKDKCDKEPAGGPFRVLSQAYAAKAGALPEDQRIYIGPFALDPDAMGLARSILKDAGLRGVEAVVEAMLARIEQHAAAEGPLAVDGRIEIPPPGAADAAFPVALRNERVFESLEPLYGVFRSFWRDTFVSVATTLSGASRPVSAREMKNAVGFAAPQQFNPGDNGYLSEYLTPANRFPGYDPNSLVDRIRAEILKLFVRFAVGLEELADLQGARLSGPSRLAFRLDCEPAAAVDAREAGVAKSSGDGPTHPGAGSARFLPIDFTFEALTDWSRFEAAVTKRARKMFDALPSGVLPRPGLRSENPSDHEMLRFQGFMEAPTTGAARMIEVQASLKSARLSRRTDNRDRPFPGEPLDFETAIEIPSRLILSTAQDAIWRTNRRMPPELTATAERMPIRPVAREPGLEEGGTIAAGKSVSAQPRDLYSIRLETYDGMELKKRPAAISLRAVGSPDLRPTALTGFRAGDPYRMPSQGAPPRGPYAPWFVGPEQSETGTLTVEQIKVGPPARPDATCTDGAEQQKKKPGLIRWLCERAGLLETLPKNQRFFRTSLDAFDRHQLVLLSSVYGLPVIGKREQLKGADPDDVEAFGGLIEGSGQVEPGTAFALLDAPNDQALHKPVPLNVKALSLTALGGSFLHDTAFKPSAGVDDLRGNKIFEGFSIDTLQQDIVLGREIRTEVVYKGYLLPLGHKASFVKLTERTFLRTPTQGIKAVLRQRMFLRMSEPVKLYGALGQPHAGRMWCGKYVRLIADRTPDILDPSFPIDGEPTAEKPESLNGRIHLGGGAGLAFWPRTDITDGGVHRFEISIDGTLTALPMLFLDNIAATTPLSCRAAVEHYNGNLPEAMREAERGRLVAELRERRRLLVGGRKIDYAPNSRDGECQFETNFIRVRAHGRLLTPPSGNWTGLLDAADNFKTTGVLEGAEQPPFYPAMELAEIRCGPVERMSGGKPTPVEVQYDGHYVLYGFHNDPPPRGAERPTGASANPREVFLDLRKPLRMRMGANGDRSGGITRPETYIVALCRKSGPLGGDEATWWATGPSHLTAGNAIKESPDEKGRPRDIVVPEPTALVSLAPYFNPDVSRVDVDRPPLPEGTSAPVIPAQEPSPDQLKFVKQIQSCFNFDAKLLQTVTIRDLALLCDLDIDSAPVLKEVLEFGTAALREADSAAATVANDVRRRVLVPLKDVVTLLRAEWRKLDAELAAQQADLPPITKPDGTSSTPVLTLAALHPEIDGSLETLERELTEALRTEDALSLVAELADIHSAARTLVRGLAIVASNPVERLEEAVVGNVRAYAAALTAALTELTALIGSLALLRDTFLDAAADNAAETITEWIFTAVPVAPGGGGNVQVAETLADVLAVAAAPPALPKILAALVADVAGGIPALAAAATTATQTLAAAVESATATHVRATVKAIILAALRGEDVGAALDLGLEAFRQDVKALVRAAVVTARAELDAFAASADAATQQAAVALQAELDRYGTRLLVGAIETAADRYPEELATLVAALDRLDAAIRSGRTVAEAVDGGDPEAVLAAGAAFAQDVLGIDIDTLQAPLRDVTQQLLTAARAAAADVFDVGPLAFDPLAPAAGVSAAPPTKGAVLRDEAMRCAQPAPLRLPVTHNGDVVASCSILLALGHAIEALTDVRAALPDLDTVLDDNAIEAVADLKPRLDAFRSDLGELIGAEDATADALLPELSALYAAIVALQVARRDFDAGALADDLDRGAIEQLSALASQLRALGEEIGGRITKILRLLTTFASRHAAILVAGATIGAIAEYLDAIGVLTKLSSDNQKLLENFKRTADELERDLVAALVATVQLGLVVVKTSSAGASTGIDTAVAALRSLEAAAAPFGIVLRPETDRLRSALVGVKGRLDALALSTLTGNPQTIAAFRAVTIGGRPVEQFFAGSPPTHKSFAETAQALRDLEGAVLREWRRLLNRIAGAPAALRAKAEDGLVATGTLGAVAAGYRLIAERRKTLYAQVEGTATLAAFANLLLVESDNALGAGTCTIPGNPLTPACDRLAQERDVLADVTGIVGKPESERVPLRRRLLAFLRGWSSGRAAPLVIVASAETLGKDLLRGNLLAAIDLDAFRDQIEDAIVGLIPTKVNFAYDFASTIRTTSNKDAIFQPAFGAPFGIVLRASLDLINGGTEFSATAHIGPFDIYLIGGVVDALRLKFGGAGFTARLNASPRLDIIYEDFVIGDQLKFAQQLQSFLTPKEGNGVFIQPLTRSAGIEVGYGINLGTIGVGATSFFNVSLNVSAELPFDEGESLFKVSLGRRLSPFTMGVFPFVGSGYFAIFAAADGVRGFEASFEYGGGAAIGYGPLEAYCRIQVGVFIRIIKVDGQRKTEIYGTFFAGGSASIWVFSFSTSLYVRLGTAADGEMYGEAIYSFSFSLGIADFDYSITAFRREQPIGGGRTAALGSPGQETRFASGDGGWLLAGHSGSGSAVDAAATVTKAADQATDWNRYARYFDTTLLKGLVG